MLLENLLNALKDPTVLRGIVLVCTAAGLQVSPEMVTQVVSIGLGVAGLIGMVSGKFKGKS